MREKIPGECARLPYKPKVTFICSGLSKCPKTTPHGKATKLPPWRNGWRTIPWGNGWASSQSASGRWLNSAKARVPDDELRARRLAARRARGMGSTGDKRKCLSRAGDGADGANRQVREGRDRPSTPKASSLVRLVRRPSRVSPPSPFVAAVKGGIERTDGLQERVVSGSAACISSSRSLNLNVRS